MSFKLTPLVASLALMGLSGAVLAQSAEPQRVTITGSSISASPPRAPSPRR